MPGTVELTIALHRAFRSPGTRIIWDTGHQIYPHKLVTGRFPQFDSMRVKGGLMGYPNPQESDYDLFMTGHAGCAPADHHHVVLVHHCLLQKPLARDTARIAKATRMFAKMASQKGLEG